MVVIMLYNTTLTSQLHSLTASFPLFFFFFGIMSTTKHLQLEGLPQAYWTWNFNNNMNTPTYQHQRNHHHHYFQHQEEQDGHGAQREHLFEKLLTPSDVGKLNRLVIPKQHAERHFPLDAESGEKGFLLSFECEAGKAWRFRYSYWTSSQSYVLTKGWSRFVKEKRLDAGDVVLFERRRSDAGRLYIGWKRRKDVVLGNHDLPTPDNTNISVVPWNNPIVRSSTSSSAPSSLSRFVSGELQQDFNFPEETTNPKRLRLFGVNLECATEVPDHPRIDPRELQLLPPGNGFSTFLLIYPR